MIHSDTYRGATAHLRHGLPNERLGDLLHHLPSHKHAHSTQCQPRITLFLRTTLSLLRNPESLPALLPSHLSMVRAMPSTPSQPYTHRPPGPLPKQSPCPSGPLLTLQRLYHTILVCVCALTTVLMLSTASRTSGMATSLATGTTSSTARISAMPKPRPICVHGTGRRGGAHGQTHMSVGRQALAGQRTQAAASSNAAFCGTVKSQHSSSSLRSSLWVR